MTYELHDYQKLAVSFLQHNPRAGLFLDMGLGKTGCVLSALTPAHLPALVIAPKRVAEDTWPEERDNWRPDLSYSLAAGSPAERKSALLEGSDLTFIGRDNVGDLGPFRDNYNTLVLDELSGYKSKGVRWKVANALQLRTEHVWGLTGTPSPNGYMDLFYQVMLLDGGKRLGTRIGAFRNKYFYPGNRLPNGIVTEWRLQEGADDRIKAKIEDLCLYMESDGRVDLPMSPPPVDHMITLPKDVMRFYTTLKKKMVADLDSLGIHLAMDSAGVLSNKLSQISAGFSYDVDELGQRTGTTTTLHTERIDMVKDLLDQATSPVLVAYRFQEEQRLLMQLKGARSIREPGIIKEWNRGEVPILVAHPASAGHGLNLQYGGHTIIWSSPVWELELWLQFNKRLLRQGQKHPVTIHKVIAKGTVDTHTYNRLDQKDGVQQDLLDHLKSPV